MSGISGVRGDAPAEVLAETARSLLGGSGAQGGGSAGVAMAARVGSFLVAGSRYLVAADARLDDRRDLAISLSVDAQDDGALILAAWDRWGEHAPSRLYGDFAIAVWDRVERTLTLARDAMGMRPLFFTPTAFASRADAFGILDRRHLQPSSETLLAYLHWQDHGDDAFFEGVSQVRPGETVVLDGRRTRRDLWWRPSTTAVRRRPADVLADVRDLLTQAVRTRIEDGGPTLAAHFSAGLDSATAAAIAAHVKPAETRLLALTAVPAFPLTDPRGRLVDEGEPAARAAATLPGVEHRRIPPAGNLVAAMLSASHIYQRPLPNPHNYLWVQAIHDQAADAGARILLIGQAGNSSFSMGDARLARARARVRRLLGERPGYALPLLKANCVTPAADPLLPPPGRARRLYSLRRLNPGPFVAGVADHWGMAVRDPFVDRRLVEVSLQIPDSVLAYFGDRGLARRIAAEMLPADFAANRRRGHQSADWLAHLRVARPALLAMIGQARDQALLDAWIDLPACIAAMHDLDRIAQPTPAEESFYRAHLPTVLAVVGFTLSLSGGTVAGVADGAA